MRLDGRAPNELRPVKITPGYLSFAEGSALIELGNTRVLCAASVEERVPNFMRGRGTGWVTAEYAMLPRSTLTRSPRTGAPGKSEGRAQEIQRLIGRSLRAATRLDALGERTIILDCDVLQADGGTRTAAITGAYVALSQALGTLVSREVLTEAPLKLGIAATSVGMVDGEPLLDLSYEEDSRADVDFNVVMTDRGDFVELQGTAETRPFSRLTVGSILDLAEKGIRQLLKLQCETLRDLGVYLPESRGRQKNV